MRKYIVPQTETLTPTATQPTNTPTLTETPTATLPPPPLAFTQADFTYDGDRARVKSVTTTTQGSSTIYFVNNYYEVTDGVITKYYYAGSQRLAMRKDGVLSYILGDHLGSTSLVTDATGNVISDTKYKAWGEERYTSGTKQTPYSFTGQYGHQAEFGLLFYNSRYYDPSLSRFTSADSIVPAGVQGLDRYAYVNNSPVRYTDPSGHVCSDPENPNGGCEGGAATLSNNYTSRQLKSLLMDRYGWDVSSDFTEGELKIIRQTASDIESYVDNLTSGMGLEWMLIFLGGTAFAPKSSAAYSIQNTTQGQHLTLPKWLSPHDINSNVIYLQSGRDFNERWIVHELGHVWDMNTGKTMPWGATGGAGDDLNHLMSGWVNGTNSRFAAGTGKDYLPSTSLYNGNAYANNSTADYLAESFTFAIYPSYNPGGPGSSTAIYLTSFLIAAQASIVR